MIKHGFVATVIFLAAGALHAETWEPVIGDDLESLFSGTVQTADLGGGNKAVATYDADGTGQLEAWNDTFERSWKLDGSDLVCIGIGEKFRCYRVEKNIDKPDEYRGTVVSTGETVIFTVDGQQARVQQPVSTGAGGSAQPSADEVARKLANPANPVMTIGNNFDFVAFTGDAQGADDQSAFRYVFQTVFPYKLADNKGTLFFRPAIPVLFNEPVPNGLGGFETKGVVLGEIGYDLSFSNTSPTGLLYGGGLVGTIPTATDDALGKDQWALGPEAILGIIGKRGVFGGVLAHQWDVGGGDPGVETSLTTLNYFYAYFLDDGWSIAAAPTISYNHEAVNSSDRLTLPIGIGISKTSIIKGRPWKFQLQYWNTIEGASAFHAEHQIRLSINPVVSAPWNEGR